MNDMNAKSYILMSHHIKVLKAALVYNVAVLLFFFAVYVTVDFGKHFRAAEPVTLRGKMYFAMMTHTGAGTNDIVPRTDFARMVTGLHVFIAWMQLLLVFLSR